MSAKLSRQASPVRRASAIALTEQQQAIVGHNHGPALVFAVAGSGKTTAMVHRVARLVREGVFRAEEILATSFNKDANRRIEQNLARQPGCDRVAVKTLHALGYQIVRDAQRRGYMPHLKSGERGGALTLSAGQILQETIAAARANRVRWAGQLDGLDRDGFLNFVGACKANLAYPDPGRARLPRWARKVASRAQAPRESPWILDLYAAFENERLRQGALTFDDMLLSGWELLCRHEDILETFRRRYRCVIVDEYQDINRAQSEILHLITQLHRNYMAIGDDDQTIYEWRGANPKFFLGFKRRYRAAVYFMTDNFRCQASQVVLANQVIRHNHERQPKRLALTQGFGGGTELMLHENRDEMGQAIAARIKRALAGELQPRDIAVLIRVHAQAAIFQEHLTAGSIPFAVVENDAEPSRMPANEVTITTLFKAKGLEWPLVFVPDCNEGVIPLRRSERLEEERRLLYVALTRATQQLSLHAVSGKPISPFLTEANVSEVLPAVAEMRTALESDPKNWRATEFAAVAINAQRLDLNSYFERWWQSGKEHRQGVAQAVLRFYVTAQQTRVFQHLNIGKSDLDMWRSLASSTVDLTPLDDPAIIVFLEQLRPKRSKRRNGRWFS